MLISTPISIGELLDKITILQIKSERIKQKEKLKYIHEELEALSNKADQAGILTTTVKSLQKKLKSINEALWEIEDSIRICEKNQDFSDTFIQLARKIYFNNDMRAKLKLEINNITGSKLMEVKSYVECT